MGTPELSDTCSCLTNRPDRPRGKAAVSEPQARVWGFYSHRQPQLPWHVGKAHVVKSKAPAWRKHAAEKYTMYLCIMPSGTLKATQEEGHTQKARKQSKSVLRNLK